MSATEFLRQLRIAVMGALLVFGLGWFLAGSRASIILLMS